MEDHIVDIKVDKYGIPICGQVTNNKRNKREYVNEDILKTLGEFEKSDTDSKLDQAIYDAFWDKDGNLSKRCAKKYFGG